MIIVLCVSERCNCKSALHLFSSKVTYYNYSFEPVSMRALKMTMKSILWVILMMVSLVITYFNMEYLVRSSAHLYHDLLKYPSLRSWWKSVPHPNENDLASLSDRYDWMTKMEERYSKTVENIKNVCKTYRKENSTQVPINTLMIDERHHLAFCRNAKVGSTTWMHHFNMLLPPNKRPWHDSDGHLNDSKRAKIIKFFHEGNLHNQKDRHGLISRSIYDEFARKTSLTTFTFVRHPFERLVSAYLDKIDRKKTSFPEFVDRVLREFETTKVNIHWKSFFDRCFHCDIPYNVIGRIETFQEDVQYIILKNNLEKILDLETTLQFHSLNSSKKDTKKESLYHFLKLNLTQIQQLYAVYQMDFEMFNYDADIYFQDYYNL